MAWPIVQVEKSARIDKSTKIFGSCSYALVFICVFGKPGSFAPETSSLPFENFQDLSFSRNREGNGNFTFVVNSITSSLKVCR